MTLETQVADLVTATTALTTAVNVQKTTLDNSVAAATAQAVTSSNSASSVAVLATTSTTQAGLSATSASQALASMNATFAAQVTATSPNEMLGAVSATEHSGAVTACLKIETSLDSDGGAWRKRVEHTSWYNETLNGVWLGRAATAAAGWALSGAVTGAYFQNTSDSKFYTLGASSPAVTETFRGNRAEFPSSPEFVAETVRVVIYDGDKPDRPMWMAIKAATNVGINSSQPITSIAYANGKLWIGMGDRLSAFDFIADKMFQIFNSALGCYTVPLGIASRHASISSTNVIYTGNPIVSAAINSIAVTILPDAPIDLVTGVQVPTVVVGTAGGISIINSNGTVANKTFSGNVVSKVLFDKRGGLWACFSNGSAGAYAYYADLTSTSSSLPAVTHCNQSWAGTWDVFGTQPKVATVAQNCLVIGSNSGVNLVVGTGNLRGVNSMTALINTAYNTGWLVGDNRACLLCDTVAETISASGELVTNGTFTADTSSWTPQNSAALSAAGAMLTVTNDGTGTNAGMASQVLNTVVGKSYVVMADFIKGTATQGAIFIGTAAKASDLGVQNMTASGKITLTFQATSTTTYLSALNNVLTAGITSQFDNFSCQLATPDRSVKNKGAILVGTLTKTLYGGVSMYSGFNGAASNYFEQPYNVDMDVGTGDLGIEYWDYVSVANLQHYTFSRGTVGLASTLGLNVPSDGIYKIIVGGTSISTGISQTAGLHKFNVVRESGVLKFYIDGVLVFSVANTTSVTNTSAILRLGTDSNTAAWAGATSMGMFRFSATAPSADQVAFAYEQERKMFLPGAVVTLAGSSNSIIAIDYCPTTNMYHPVTPWGRTGMCELVRVDSEATTVGTPTAISAEDGVILFGGSTGSKVYQPAYFLREEFKRKELAAKALGKIPVFFDFDATASQTAFVVPKGYTAKAVYSAGTLKRVGTTKDYLMSYDGFAETVTFNTGLSLNTWVSIMCVRA